MTLGEYSPSPRYFWRFSLVRLTCYNFCKQNISKKLSVVINDDELIKLLHRLFSCGTDAESASNNLIASYASYLKYSSLSTIETWERCFHCSSKWVKNCTARKALQVHNFHARVLSYLVHHHWSNAIWSSYPFLTWRDITTWNNTGAGGHITAPFVRMGKQRTKTDWMSPRFTVRGCSTPVILWEPVRSLVLMRSYRIEDEGRLETIFESIFLQGQSQVLVHICRSGKNP